MRWRVGTVAVANRYVNLHRHTRKVIQRVARGTEHNTCLRRGVFEELSMDLSSDISG